MTPGPVKQLIILNSLKVRTSAYAVLCFLKRMFGGPLNSFLILIGILPEYTFYFMEEIGYA